MSKKTASDRTTDIKTLQPGDEVWLMYNNVPAKGQVLTVCLHLHLDEPSNTVRHECTYRVRYLVPHGETAYWKIDTFARESLFVTPGDLQNYFNKAFERALNSKIT